MNEICLGSDFGVVTAGWLLCSWPVMTASKSGNQSSTTMCIMSRVAAAECIWHHVVLALDVSNIKLECDPEGKMTLAL